MFITPAFLGAKKLGSLAGGLYPKQFFRPGIEIRHFFIFRGNIPYIQYDTVRYRVTVPGTVPV
jgi:hypothetical protein